MSDDKLSGARAKIARATQHASVLFEHERDWIKTAPLKQRFWIDPSTYEEAAPTVDLVCVMTFPELPQWAPIVGDAIQNARTALEYVAHEFVLAGSKPSGRSFWPIFSSPPPAGTSPLARIAKDLPGASAAQLAFAEKAQPYHDAHDPFSHPLSILRTLSNRDKHELLVGSFSALIPRLMIDASDFGFPDGVPAPLYPDRPPPDDPTLVFNNHVELSGPVQVIGPVRYGVNPEEAYRVKIFCAVLPPQFTVVDGPKPQVVFGDRDHPCTTNRIMEIVATAADLVDRAEALL